MLDGFAVEKLAQIRAGFAALQAENEELRAELEAAKARIAELEAEREG
jgi:cell division protein FtsB